jgi:hypothetical protein
MSLNKSANNPIPTAGIPGPSTEAGAPDPNTTGILNSYFLNKFYPIVFKELLVDLKFLFKI